MHGIESESRVQMEFLAGTLSLLSLGMDDVVMCVK